jgi:hypothetical protein
MTFCVGSTSQRGGGPAGVFHAVRVTAAWAATAVCGERVTNVWPELNFPSLEVDEECTFCRVARDELI